MHILSSLMEFTLHSTYTHVYGWSHHSSSNSHKNGEIIQFSIAKAQSFFRIQFSFLSLIPFAFIVYIFYSSFKIAILIKQRLLCIPPPFRPLSQIPCWYMNECKCFNLNLIVMLIENQLLFKHFCFCCLFLHKFMRSLPVSLTLKMTSSIPNALDLLC